MKKQFLLMAACLTILANVYAGTNSIENNFKKISANEKAMKNFHKRYENVSGEVWNPIQNGYAANFVTNGHNTIAIYNNKGNWAYTIERYKADNLPLDLIERVKEDYDRYYIAGAEKIDTPASSVIIVHLENKEWYKTIRVDDSGIKLLQQFKKIK